MGKFIDLTGKPFGRLTVIAQAPNQARRVAWYCECSGSSCQKNVIIVKSYYLINGDTRSCGCLSREIHTKHGLWYTRLYKAWANIIKRTTNFNDDNYQYYGARNIKICHEWRYNPEKFIKYCETLPGWDDPKLTLDRIDNNKGYEPRNLRFTTISQQNTNRRAYSNTGEKYISYYKKDSMYHISKNENGKTKHYGSFKILQEAVNHKLRNNL